jgi:CHAT domain-containing protein
MMSSIAPADTVPTVSASLGAQFRLSLEAAQKLAAKAEKLTWNGDYAEATRTLEEALKLTEASLGSNHLDVANLLTSIADVSIDRGSIKEAAKLLERSLDVGQKNSAETNVIFADALKCQGKLKLVEGKLNEAVALYRQSLSVYEQACGKDHLAVGTCLGALGTAQLLRGEHSDALKALQGSRSIIEKSLGTNHPLTGLVLSTLAEAYLDMADYERAKKLAQASIEVRVATLGIDHPAVAESLYFLAMVSLDQGDYAEAESLLLRSLRIMEKAWGTSHHKIAVCVDRLAEVYKLQGDYVNQLRMVERSLGIKEATVGRKHPLYANSLETFAETQRRLGNQDLALKALGLCLEIRADTFGAEHPDVANTLEEIGAVFLEKEDYAQALVLFERTLELREKALGKEHPHVAVSLASLAVLWHRLGRHDRCQELRARSLAIEEKVYGPLHPDVIRTRLNIAVERAQLGNVDEAITGYRIALDAMRRYLAGQLGRVAHGTALLINRDLFIYLDIFQSVCSSSLAKELTTTKIAGVEQSALSKALYEEVEATRAALEADPRTSTQKLREQHQASEMQLARLAEREFDSTKRDTMRRDLQDALNKLQAGLAERIGLVAQTIRERNLTLPDVARGLPSQAALVDFVHYRRFDFTAKTNHWREARYAAYLTFPLAKDSTNAVVERVDLGEAAPINEAVEIICRRMGAGQFRAKDLEAALQRVSELVYAPLARHLTNVSHLIVCPDGKLSRVPFEMLLVSGRGEPPRYLVVEKTISYVGSGREVARLAQPVSPKPGGQGSKSVVMGNPDFDLNLSSGSRREEALISGSPDVSNRSQSEGNARPHPDPLPQEREKLALRLGETGAFAPGRATNGQSLLTSAATRSLSRSYQGITFSPLPGSEQEARNVAKLLGGDTILRLGAEAREAELKAVVSPRVLHLATHGFFLTDQEFKRTNAMPDFLASTSSFIPRRSRAAEEWENPMVRCGIALAGANHAARITNAVTEDGLLTGLEASLLNLQGTELVILSACESGAGEVKIGEGVMSLRRAFRIAGAETVLASHWKVSDQATSRLMTEFMRRWRGGEPRSKAWREAQLALLRSEKFSNPYFWAAFTLTGQWR